MRNLERTAAGLSFAAGGLHLMAGPAHLEEWWAYGLFFFGAAAGQAAYGLVLFTQGIEGWGGWLVVRGRIYLAGIVGTLAIIALWAVSRTVGVPVGPEAFEPEGLGVLDGASKAVEVVLVAVLFRLRSLAGAAKPGP
ncbi:MAG: hypothetical protein AABY18_00505 [Candidatus Thermoplasmatota archaeon]